jgi:hypothetical protein
MLLGTHALREAVNGGDAGDSPEPQKEEAPR